jgi:hypothetical protein
LPADKIGNWGKTGLFGLPEQGAGSHHLKKRESAQRWGMIFAAP